MKYITTEEFVSSIGRQVSIELTDGVDRPELDILEIVNEFAVAEADCYLRGTYTIPLSEPVPQFIQSIVSDIMLYALYKRRNPKNLSESVIAIYNLAIGKLRDLKEGKIVVDAAKFSSEGIK